MKQRIIQVSLVVALVAAVVVLRERDQLYDTPEATISAFFEAAGKGEDKLYLRLTTGELKRELLQLRKQQGMATFREEMRRSTTGVKGRAMTRGRNAPNGLIAVDVEHVFVDRNEEQRFLLSETGSGWLIQSIGQADVSRPLIPYGTPVMPPADPEEAKAPEPE
ncbi:MAG: hypothetical protein HN742_15325 [Lentisphaerae bacterium]|jgi:hypothetical protein|nr:hypothetical protein [Lentisphaerota bacterium]MBT4817586.1 hypothetical protein [Lentisphaerota bacterium]MBT5608531.1 hypothetical protein [Lentisphaerota bacterium]MBT7060244.1 hypothetical protein [Lentisphaerota bacterium]MBT7843248.1 hypothetical protein [Lentisphaerota bacterium]